MESVLSRYRNLNILVGVLFLQVLGLAMQVKRGNDTQDTRLIRIWAVGAMSPRLRAILQIAVLLAVVVALVMLFPRAYAFVEMAARELRYFWWLILLVALAIWLIG